MKTTNQSQSLFQPIRETAKNSGSQSERQPSRFTPRGKLHARFEERCLTFLLSLTFFLHTTTNCTMRATLPCLRCHPEHNKSIGHCGPCVVRSAESARQRRNEVCVCLFCFVFFTVLLLLLCCCLLLCFVHSGRALFFIERAVYLCVVCVSVSFSCAYFIEKETKPAETKTPGTLPPSVRANSLPPSVRANLLL